MPTCLAELILFMSQSKVSSWPCEAVKDSQELGKFALIPDCLSPFCTVSRDHSGAASDHTGLPFAAG